MIFTSFTFLAFVSIVLLLYHALSHKGQNLMLLIASYIFYGWWDWRFTSLLLFSTVIDYGVGLGLVSERLRPFRKSLLTTSIIIQLGLLAVFKYYDFFAVSLSGAMAEVGWHVDPWLLRVTLPVGISFYTFHTLSYTIDIYKGKFYPTKDFIAFALFISFFPQLVAGPIARAKHLLPQMLAPRRVTWRDWQEGCYLFYWGLFKKVVVADGMATIVNQVFADPTSRECRHAAGRACTPSRGRSTATSPVTPTWRAAVRGGSGSTSRSISTSRTSRSSRASSGSGGTFRCPACCGTTCTSLSAATGLAPSAPTPTW